MTPRVNPEQQKNGVAINEEREEYLPEKQFWWEYQELNFGQVNVGITIKYPCRKIDRWSNE